MSSLLDKQHKGTEVAEVLARLAADDHAYFDERKNVREVPVFRYVDNEPIEIAFWSKRLCAPPGMPLKEAADKGLDYYHETRGWIRSGKKAEKDFQETR